MRLIDVDKLKPDAEYNAWDGKFTAYSVKQIEEAPMVEVVNCIECAYLGEDWWCYKHEFTPIPIEDFFCKDGERKDNE